ncbi:MAG: hypothetical protein WCD79_00075 [Chthoniobacteraceae bacterium]
MKFLRNLFFLLLLIWTSSLSAQDAALNRFEVESNWPGLLMQLMSLKRLPDDHVMVLVRLQTTSKSPPSTLIGVRVPIPPGTTKAELQSGAFTPQPFSFAGAVMTDEWTKEVYPVVPPAPKATAVAPFAIMTNLRQGQAFVIAVEFKVPPPLDDGTGHPMKQIVSLALPNAKAAFVNLPIPPDISAAAPAASH